jgi:hypothetical protein
MTVDGSKKPRPMWWYLAMWVLPDPQMGKGFLANHARSEILKAFQGASEPRLALDDEWVERMYKCVMNPSLDIPAWAAVQFLPFQKAIVDAWKGGSGNG